MAEKILIVDDDVDSLKLIALMLKRHGYEVSVADAGSKALAKAESEHPDLIILDVMMPDMNGLEVCRRLRGNEVTNDIPIIMFTAKTLIDDKVKGFEAGADDYLTKPTHPAELASRVKAILARKAAERANAPVVEKTTSPGSAPKRGMTIGVMGAKGGVGTTTVAVNVAAALLKASEQPIVADFRLGFGNLGHMLGAQIPGIANLLDQATITLESVQQEVVTHQSGLKALVSSSNPYESQMEFPFERATNIVELLRTIGNPAIIDLGIGLTPLNKSLLPEMDKVFFVVEANTTTLEIAADHLREIENIIGGGRISIVVVNRSQSTLPWHEVENILGREVKSIISAAPELAFQALEKRVPMVLTQSNAMVSGQFAKLADDMKSRLRSINQS